jgi:hypothetical protein
LTRWRCLKGAIDELKLGTSTAHFGFPREELAMAELKVVDVTEQKRLNDAREVGVPWKKWGPLLQARIVTEQVGGEPVAV